MKVKHLGGGVVLIEELLDAEMLSSINFDLIESNCIPQGHKIINKKTFLEGGYKVEKKAIQSIPIRYMQDIEKLPFYNAIENAAYLACVEYCKLFPIAAESITNHTAKHFIKYLPGCKMGPHSDSSLAYKDGTLEVVSMVALGNTITSSLILNDTFAGGGIYFPAWDIEVFPKAGSALFYPSNYIGAHEVYEVTSGVRWAFLSFFAHAERHYENPDYNLNIKKYEEQYKWMINFKNDISLGGNNLNQLQKKVI
jgi:hypothetical protein